MAQPKSSPSKSYSDFFYFCFFLYTRNFDSKIFFPLRSSSFSEQQWENFSDVNIKNGEATRLNSVQLRNIVDSNLQQVANDIQKQIELTNR